METPRFVSWLRSHGILDEDTQQVCLQLKGDTCDLLVTLDAHFSLLDGIEKYLDDWMWAVFHQMVHQGANAQISVIPKWVL